MGSGEEESESHSVSPWVVVSEAWNVTLERCEEEEARVERSSSVELQRGVMVRRRWEVEDDVVGLIAGSLLWGDIRLPFFLFFLCCCDALQ